jgi:hypothetical protein
MREGKNFMKGKYAAEIKCENERARGLTNSVENETRKFSIIITSVGLARTRPNIFQL